MIGCFAPQQFVIRGGNVGVEKGCTQATPEGAKALFHQVVRHGIVGSCVFELDAVLPVRAIGHFFELVIFASVI